MRVSIKDITQYILKDTYLDLRTELNTYIKSNNTDIKQPSRIRYLFVDCDGWYLCEDYSIVKDTELSARYCAQILDTQNPFEWDGDDLTQRLKNILYKLYKETWNKQEVAHIIKISLVGDIDDYDTPVLNDSEKLSKVLEDNFNKIDDSISELKKKIATNEKAISVWEEEIKKLEIIKRKLL
jgi:hypothetical protein